LVPSASIQIQTLQEKKIRSICFIFLILLNLLCAQVLFAQVKSGADRISTWLPLLKNKDVAVVANRASLTGNVNLVDTLFRSGIHVAKIFCPEHGFRDFAEAGKPVVSFTDSITGIPVISLYGKKKKPSREDLEDVDLLLFDLQDVGVRCFTYLSTLSYVMEACAESRIPVLLLDRPNPNGFYIDGPVLDSMNISFVGLHPVPLVYGMTIGEYAQMINGEGWLKNGMICELQVIMLENYSHRTRCVLPVAPSPNLPTMNAVYLYPSLCLFEGTIISVGRGTPFPFEVFGHPGMKGMPFAFTPLSKTTSPVPLFNGQECYGLDLRNAFEENPGLSGRVNLSWLILSFGNLGNDPKYFTPFFDKLAGNQQLKDQIVHGMSAEEIHRTWEESLSRFRETRIRYLLYPE
jgi:uncharacterized protein YbbC (DUF1343 family)